jgi:hypothetical protein
MKTFNNIGGAILTSQTEGRAQVITPAAKGYTCREGEIFDLLVDKFKFNEFLDQLREPRELAGAEDTEWYRQHLAQLRQDLEGGRIEIDIKLRYVKEC